jgi:predicted metal-dependent enzyme (double-stranded beta helix superfamily)
LRKKKTERLIEQDRMLVPLHEHGVQRPVEIIAGADARRLYRFERIEHRTRPDRNPRRAQGARKVEDVIG